MHGVDRPGGANGGEGLHRLGEDCFSADTGCGGIIGFDLIRHLDCFRNGACGLIPLWLWYEGVHASGGIQN